MASLALLPSRKKMMLGRTGVSSKKTSFAYVSALLAFFFIIILLISWTVQPDMFKKMTATIFLWANMFLAGGVGMAIVVETRWATNFSRELSSTSSTVSIESSSRGQENEAAPAQAASTTPPKVEVLQQSKEHAVHIHCPMCKQEMLVPHELLGHVISCPNCGVQGRIGGG
ncbi:MAG: hypothetical protein QCI38_00690 [Candidatus Thermoplasmatota archaeon]|nr:hypothetical protein [Candidatus Thermoplasmatota archaeon]